MSWWDEGGGDEGGEIDWLGLVGDVIDIVGGADDEGGGVGRDIGGGGAPPPPPAVFIPQDVSSSFSGPDLQYSAPDPGWQLTGGGDPGPITSRGGGDGVDDGNFGGGSLFDTGIWTPPPAPVQIFGGGLGGDWGGGLPVNLPVPQGGPADVIDGGGNMEGGNGFMPVSVPGAIGAGAIWLGTYLARAFGRGAGAQVFQAANGVRVRLAQLWPLVRRYGPQSVAGALGVSVGSLGTLLMQAPTTGTRKRRRGISARDLATSKRTIRQVQRFSRMLGLGRGAGRGRTYRPRRRYGARYC